MLNYCAKGTVVAAQQLRRAMKIHNGLPLPCNQGGKGFLANTRNHKWIWREHFPFHFSICKCSFHSSSQCLNQCGGVGGTLHSKPTTGTGERGRAGRVWGLGTSQRIPAELWVHPEHSSASSPPPAEC